MALSRPKDGFDSRTRCQFPWEAIRREATASCKPRQDQLPWPRLRRKEWRYMPPVEGLRQWPLPNHAAAVIRLRRPRIPDPDHFSNYHRRPAAYRWHRATEESGPPKDW